MKYRIFFCEINCEKASYKHIYFLKLSDIGIEVYLPHLYKIPSL